MESVKPLKSFFGRTGGKHFSKNKILPFLKDIKYDTYVEPFIGAGSIFLGRDKKVKKEVINDFDNLVVNLWDGMKCCGDQLKDYKLYFMDKSVFKWWLLKEKQNRRERMKKGIFPNNNKKIETLKEDLFITQKSYCKNNKKSNYIELIDCGCIKNNNSSRKNKELKIEIIEEEKEDEDVCCSIEKTDEGLKLVKKKYYVKNKKKEDKPENWRLHNPNLCGWNDLMKNCDKYYERLRDVEIYQGDYKKMLKYDSHTTLFYFDPPWTITASGKKGNKCYSGFVELEDFYNSIKNLKGKWFCSYNNHPDIIKRFEGHRIEYINTTYTQKKEGNKKTIDILIFSKNFFN